MPLSAPFLIFSVNPKSILKLKVPQSHHHFAYIVFRTQPTTTPSHQCAEEIMGKEDSNIILMNTREEGSRRRKRMEKCVTNEEWCFLCYVGGLLLFCEHEDCIKACHPKCLGKDDSVVNSGNSWTCDAHSCFICYKGQDFNCVGCPKTLCRRCIGQVEFVQIKGNKGLCGVCLKNVLLVEDKKDGDYDRKFMENFGSAWKIIRERESLTLKDLRCAEERMKKGDFYMCGCNSDENDERVKSDICNTFPMKNKKRHSISLFQYALIEPENMTLVYLKRGLVKKLVKGPRTLFDDKVIGSFVKIIASRNDRFDQNVFKLLQVTGTTWTYNGENDPEVLLHVSGMENKISINLLANCDVAEEECKDLKMRIQRGLLKQPTVDELEDKARILHEDIKNHWIATELQRLKNRFELACEKGWRSEMIEFEKKRDLLLKSDEQAKILNTVPHVVAAAEGELERLSKSCLKTPVTDGSSSGDQVVLDLSESSERTETVTIGPGDDDAVEQEKFEGSTAQITEEDQVVLDLSESSERTETVTIGSGDDDAVKQEKFEGSTAQMTEVNNDVQDNSPPSVPLDHQDLKWNIITPAGAVSGPYPIDDLKCVTEVLPFYSQSLMVWKGGSRNAAIRIHDAVDQENTENVTTNVTKGNKENNGPVFGKQMDTILKDLPELYVSTTTPEPITMSGEDPKWNILLPGLVEKGPYSLKNLRGLHDISSSSSQHIKVWKEGESKDTAITLRNALKLLSQKK